MFNVTVATSGCPGVPPKPPAWTMTVPVATGFVAPLRYSANALFVASCLNRNAEMPLTAVQSCRISRLSWNVDDTGTDTSDDGWQNVAGTVLVVVFDVDVISALVT